MGQLLEEMFCKQGFHWQRSLEIGVLSSEAGFDSAHVLIQTRAFELTWDDGGDISHNVSLIYLIVEPPLLFLDRISSRT